MWVVKTRVITATMMLLFASEVFAQAVIISVSPGVPTTVIPVTITVTEALCTHGPLTLVQDGNVFEIAVPLGGLCGTWPPRISTFSVGHLSAGHYVIRVISQDDRTAPPLGTASFDVVPAPIPLADNRLSAMLALTLVGIGLFVITRRRDGSCGLLGRLLALAKDGREISGAMDKVDDLDVVALETVNQAIALNQEFADVRIVFFRDNASAPSELP